MSVVFAAHQTRWPIRIVPERVRDGQRKVHAAPSAPPDCIFGTRNFSCPETGLQYTCRVGFYDTYLLPRLVHFSCGLGPAMKQRRKIVPLATGRVLEIGIGSGLNLSLYDPDRVEHLWGLDPSVEMWAIAQKNAHEHRLDVEFIQSGAESIPLEDAAADTVVMTYTLCTLPETKPALAEIRRVLKAGGRLLFCEHGLAPDPAVRRWQHRVNPVWRRLAGGCNLDRPIAELLAAAGFRCPDLQTMYIPGWKPACFNYWGTATLD